MLPPLLKVTVFCMDKCVRRTILHKNQCTQILNLLSPENSNFYSLLTDGPTDSFMTEKEAFFVMTFNPNPIGSKKVQIKINFFDLLDPEATVAAGILKSIETLFKVYQIEFY